MAIWPGRSYVMHVSVDALCEAQQRTWQSSIEVCISSSQMNLVLAPGLVSEGVSALARNLFKECFATCFTLFRKLFRGVYRNLYRNLYRTVFWTQFNWFSIKLEMFLGCFGRCIGTSRTLYRNLAEYVSEPVSESVSGMVLDGILEDISLGCRIHFRINFGGAPIITESKLTMCMNSRKHIYLSQCAFYCPSLVNCCGSWWQKVSVFVFGLATLLCYWVQRPRQLNSSKNDNADVQPWNDTLSRKGE